MASETQAYNNFLNTQYPIMGGAMTWVSEVNLVTAISRAGAFGVLACGSMTPELLQNEIRKTKIHNLSFGVNLIVKHPKILELIEITINEEVKYVILAGGLPRDIHIQRLKENNIKVIAFAPPSLRLTEKIISKGIDALIIEGSEAGGHIGPVSTGIMVQDIMLPCMNEVPFFVAGGIATPDIVKQYMNMGAAGCQIGTVLAASKESIAHDNFKQILIKSSAKDAISSVQLDQRFNVIPVRAIRNNATNEFLRLQKKIIEEYDSGIITKEKAQLKIELFWAGALKKAVIDGDIINGSLMAGESVGLIKEEKTVNNIIKDIVSFI
ncbi:MAG: nitronate monooxygenase [Anaplasmataceae bacterium]|nr:nitronate monooxygenase [Anaplasmataceae bacterium]